MIPLALRVARDYQNKVTGLIHYHYAQEDHLSAIPLYENFCFVLTLMRTKERAHLKEALELLNRLMAFDVDGDFPLYLHEYPSCTSPSHSLHGALVLSWIEKITPVAIPELRPLIERLLAKAQTKMLSWSAQMKLDALLGAFDPADYDPKSPRDWGDYLLCCTFTGQDASKALSIWNPQLALYTGENLWQEKGEPALSLVDLIMGSHYDTLSKRTLRSHPTHLHAGLVFPLQAGRPLPPEAPYHHTADPFTLHFGTLDHLHSLTCRTHAEAIKTRTLENGYELDISLPEHTPSQDALELNFYLNHTPDTRFLIDGHRATTFQLGEPITIITPSHTFELTLTLLSGEGTFCGHLFHGNRPNQLALKGQSRYATFDYHLALRTLRRTPQATFRATLLQHK